MMQIKHLDLNQNVSAENLDVSRLSRKQHWDDVHVGEQACLLNSMERPRSRIKGLLNGASLKKWMSAYDDYLLWESIFPRYLTQMRDAKVLEVGSAPGEFLVQFARRFACTPYGIDYSEVGVEVNKRVFGRNGFNPGNVIHGDFFSDHFRQQHRGCYDAVISRGFIEHFTDVESVIERHLDLLKPGGRLIVSIPNLRGVNHVLADLLDRDAIARHNIGIMRTTAFKALFDRRDLTPLFCDYYGTFSFYLFTADQSKARRSGLRFACKVQPFLNGAFRMLFGNKGLECRYFSPSLLYIGSKKANVA